MRGQAKDKEQAVLYLYRVYGLHAVKHENLRPEKAAKPPGRVAKGGDGDGEEGAEAASPKRKRARKAATSQADDDGNRPELPEDELQKPPRKRGKKATDVKDKGDAAASPRKGRNTKAKELETADLDSLVNQEDAPVPIDGAPLTVVEAEEHPEAADAAVEGVGG